MVSIKTKVKIKATGNNGSGKSYLLQKIKSFLEGEGFKIKDNLDNHELVVFNEH